MNHDSATTRLNNYLQATGEAHLLSYADSSVGPQNSMVWTVKCKFNGIVLGEGVARTKGEAKEEASRQTLETLLARA